MSMMINDKKKNAYFANQSRNKIPIGCREINSYIVNSSWKMIAYFVKHMGEKLNFVNHPMKNSQISFNCCVVMENNRIFPQALVGKKLWISSITQWKYRYFIKLLWKRIADFFSLSWKKEIWNFVNYAKKKNWFYQRISKTKIGNFVNQSLKKIANFISMSLKNIRLIIGCS